MPRRIPRTRSLPIGVPVIAPVETVAPVAPTDPAASETQPEAFAIIPPAHAVAPSVPDSPVPVMPPVLSEGSLSPRAGVMRGGGLFLRPQWLSYDSARRGLAGLGQIGQTCWLINKWTGERVIWTGQNWHIGPDADWYAHCEYYAEAPQNTFQPAPPSPSAPASPPAPVSAPSAPSSPVPPSSPPSGGVPAVGPLPGLDNLAPSDWGGGGQDFPSDAQSASRAGFPWWLLAVAGAVMLS